jgi:hypothetical protein
MTFDLEEDFQNERWRLLALVDWRNSLGDGSEGAITTDLEIVAARSLIRKYETLKGYWSPKSSPQGKPRRAIVAKLDWSKPFPESEGARNS